MKIKDKKDGFVTLSIRFNKEEQNVIYKLKESHGINICGLVKILLKQKLDQLEKINEKK